MSPLRIPVLFGSAAGVLAAMFVIGMASRHHREPQKMLPDAGGHIRGAVLQYVSGSDNVLPAYRDFLGYQPADVTLYVACPEEADFTEFRSRVGDTAARLIPVYTHHAMTAWSRDRWVALIGEKSHRVTLLSPRGEKAQENWPARAGDSHVAEELARAFSTIFSARRSDLYFDGGDLLADSGRLFVTRSVVERNVQHTVSSRGELVRALASEFGGTPILMDDAPTHHAGMFMMSTGIQRDGKPVMLVADPSLGKSLYASSPESDALFPGGPDFSVKSQSAFDAAANYAATSGFTVLRIPVVPSHNTPWMTYVNVILDRAGQTPVVYLPVFDGQDRLNAAATAVWQSLGFTVHPINCTTVWPLGGTLHCLVNVFQRDP